MVTPLTPQPPISDDEYFKLYMSKMPEAKPQRTYTVKKDDNLWKIAKEQCGASGSDVQYYVYQIAKLNKFNSPKDMDNIKINQSLILPEQANNRTKQNPVVIDSNPQVSHNGQKEQTQSSNTVQTANSKPAGGFTLFNWEIPSYQSDWEKSNAVTIPFDNRISSAKPNDSTKPKSAPAVKSTQAPAKPAEPKSNAEQGFEELKNTILQTDTSLLFATCGSRGQKVNTYTIYKYDKRTQQIPQQLATYRTDIYGNVIDISFNGKVDEAPLYHDYVISSDGQITQSDEYGRHKKNIKKIDEAGMERLNDILKEKTFEADATSIW